MIEYALLAAAIAVVVAGFPSAGHHARGQHDLFESRLRIQRQLTAPTFQFRTVAEPRSRFPRLLSFLPADRLKSPRAPCYHIAFPCFDSRQQGNRTANVWWRHWSGLPAGVPVSLRSDRPRVVAAAAGLRARRTDENRDRPRAHRERRAAFEDHRVADRDHARKQRLEELDRSAAGGGYRRRRRQEEAGDAAAAGTRRPGGVDQIQFPGCAVHSGARQRAGNDGARGAGRAGEGSFCASSESTC